MSIGLWRTAINVMAPPSTRRPRHLVLGQLVATHAHSACHGFYESCVVPLYVSCVQKYNVGERMYVSMQFEFLLAQPWAWTDIAISSSGIRRMCIPRFRIPAQQLNMSGAKSHIRGMPKTHVDLMVQVAIGYECAESGAKSPGLEPRPSQSWNLRRTTPPEYGWMQSSHSCHPSCCSTRLGTTAQRRRSTKPEHA